MAGKKAYADLRRAHHVPVHRRVALRLIPNKPRVPPAFWEWGGFETAGERDRGGYDTLARVDGTIKAAGKAYTIKNAIGLKERITVGQSSDPIKTLPAPREMYWLFTLAEETGIFLFQPGKPGLDLGNVCSDGKHLHFKPRSGQGEVSFKELARWHDPRSGLYFLCHWHLNMTSSEGVVDLDIKAHGRCWMNWVLSNGIRMNTIRTQDPNGQWFHVGDTLEHETTLVMVPSSRRGKGMEDHDFIHTGHSMAQRHELSDLSIVQTDDAVTWKAHGRTYVSKPPLWELKGEHGGVELDLVCRQMPPAIWVLGHYEEAMQRNTGGYDAQAEFEGTIKVNGKTYPINKGYGIRENMGVGRNTNIIGNLPQPDRMYWDYLVSPDIMVYLFLYPKQGIQRGIVRAFGEEFLFGANNGLGANQGSIHHTILDHWHDPRSGLALASKWHLSMASHQGVLDIQIAAHGRSYFYWTMKNGIRVEIWQIGTANGTFMLPDGRSVVLKDQLMCIDPLYTVGRAQESIRPD